jgi:hypothetical protein
MVNSNGEMTCSESKTMSSGSIHRSSDSADLVARDNKENSREGVHEEDRSNQLRDNVSERPRENWVEKRLGSRAVSQNIDEEAD